MDFIDIDCSIDDELFLVKRMDQESSKQSRTVKTNNENEEAIQSESVINRRPSRHLQSEELNSSINDLSSNSQQEELIEDQTSKFLLLDSLQFKSLL